MTKEHKTKGHKGNKEEKEDVKMKKHTENKSNERKKEVSLEVSKRNLIIISIIASLVVGFVVGYALHIPTNTSKTISPTKAGELAKNTIYYYYSSMGVDFDSLSLKIDVNKVNEYNNYLYEVYLNINGNTLPQPIYISADGKYVFPQKIDAVSHFEIPKANIPKSDKPNVSINVMAFCPYGNQMEDAIVNVMHLLKDKVNFVPHFIIYKGNTYGNKGVEINGETYWSLHGMNELNQDVRERIIYDMYGPQTWIDYAVKVNKKCDVNNVETCWKDVANEMGLDVNAIESKYKEEYNKIVLEEYNQTSAKGISASPTLIINEYQYKGGRTPNALKEAICNAFNNPPPECNENISDSGVEQVPAGSCG